MINKKKTVIQLGVIILHTTLMNFTYQKYDEKRPTDFSFKITDTVDRYDSKNGIFIRKYAMKDTVVVVHLSLKELDEIYESFKEIDFMEFPTEFECAAHATRTMPIFSQTLEITYKEKIKKVLNSSYCDRKNDQLKSDKFDKLCHDIMTILNNKAEIKRIRECDIIFF